MLLMCCVLVNVLFFKEYDRMYGVAKEGYGQGYEVCCVLVVNFF